MSAISDKPVDTGPIGHLTGSTLLDIAVYLASLLPFLAVLFYLFRVAQKGGLAGLVNRTAEAVFDIASSLIGVSSPNSQPDNLQRDIDQIKRLIERDSKSSLSISKDAENKIVSLFEDAVSAGLNDEIKLAIEAVVARGINDDERLKTNQDITRVCDRLAQASKDASVRGFFNLAIGFGFASASLAILKSAVDLFTASDLVRLTTPQVLYLMSIRVSLALIITLIAYFFLTLYKRSLDDVRFYQNEITSVSLCGTSLTIANSSTSDETKRAISLAILQRTSTDFAKDAPSTNSTIAEIILSKIVDKIPDIATK